MSQKDLEQFVLETIKDGEFRQLLLEDPEKALRQIGIEPKPEICAAVRGLDYPTLQALARSFGHPDVNMVQ